MSVAYRHTLCDFFQTMYDYSVKNNVRQFVAK